MVEIDRIELNRLILEGEGQSFDELTARSQEMEVTILQDSSRKLFLSIH
jgi:hypothetical protein